MPSRIMQVTWEDGTELSRSRQSPGDYSPLTRDGGTLVGHVTLSEVDDGDSTYKWQPDPEPETSPEAEALAALALLGILFAAGLVAPHVKRWWQVKAVPFGSRVKRKLSRARRPKPTSEATGREAVTVIVPAAQAGSPDVVEAMAEYGRATMSTVKARDRLVAAVVARMFADEQLRVLRDARISDDDPIIPLLNVVETLTPEQLTAGLQSMLALDPASPDAAMLTRLLSRLSTGDSDQALIARPSGPTVQPTE